MKKDLVGVRARNGRVEIGGGDGREMGSMTEEGKKQPVLVLFRAASPQTSGIKRRART